MIPVRHQMKLVMLLIVAALGQQSRAQDALLEACWPDRAVYAERIGEKLLCQAQLDQQLGQDERPQGQKHQRKMGTMGPQVKQRKYLEQFRLLKLLELLDLEEEQEVDFITAFHSMRQQRRVLHEKKKVLVNNLADGLRAGTITDNEIKQLIKEVVKLDNKDSQMKQDFLTTARRILTPQQLGKFIVFQERFELELLETVRAFRERPHGQLEPLTPEGPPPYELKEKDSF